MDPRLSISLRKQKVDAEIKRIVDEQWLGSEAFALRSTPCL